MNRRAFCKAAALAPFFTARAIGAEPSLIRPPNAAFLRDIPRLQELSRTPGVGIGIVQQGRPAWQHFAGLADPATSRPVTANSIFPAASMGKTIFAYALLKLAAEGTFDLDRPIRNYLRDDAPSGGWGEKERPGTV